MSAQEFPINGDELRRAESDYPKPYAALRENGLSHMDSIIALAAGMANFCRVCWKTYGDDCPCWKCWNDE